MSWTRFYDMSSGGKQKLEWELVYIELPLRAAADYFERRFDRDPYNVTCSCCGEDYWISEASSLEEISEYFRKGSSVEEYEKSEDVLILRREDLGDY